MPYSLKLPLEDSTLPSGVSLPEADARRAGRGIIGPVLRTFAPTFSAIDKQDLVGTPRRHQGTISSNWICHDVGERASTAVTTTRGETTTAVVQLEASLEVKLNRRHKFGWPCVRNVVLSAYELFSVHHPLLVEAYNETTNQYPAIPFKLSIMNRGLGNRRRGGVPVPLAGDPYDQDTSSLSSRGREK